MNRFLALAFLALAACGGEKLVPGSFALDEPFIVLGGQFFSGPLPGLAPGTKAPAGIPTITSIDYRSNVVLAAGQASKSFSGRVTDPAVSVGVRFNDFGTGYYVVPIGPPDPQYPGEHSFGISAAFPPGAPSGNHKLQAVGFLADGTPGVQGEVRICVQSTIPDLGHTCDPTIALPAFVIRLTWSEPVDLDLQVKLPTGRVVSSKNPFVIPPVVDPDTFVTKTDKSGGFIDRDGGRLCSPDPLRAESLVFPKAPPPGVYKVYANLFDPCGQAVATFDLHLYRSEGSGADAHFVEVTAAHTIGQLPAVQATPDTSLGQHLVDLTF